MRTHLRLSIGLIDQRAPERPSIDLSGIRVGGKENRRLIQESSVDNDVAGAQRLALPLKMNLRKDDLCAARTNIDPHRGQEDIVLLPQRIIFKRAVIEVIIMIVVVVMPR